MFYTFCACFTWPIVSSLIIHNFQDFRQPLGVRLCTELCTSFGQCLSPLYLETELRCCLSEQCGSFRNLTIRLHAQNGDIQKSSFYRRIFSRLKRPVMIRNKLALVPKPKKTPHGYVKLRAGKDTIVVKRYEKKLTWSAARYVCRSEGGDLVKMDTRQKHDAIQKRLSRRSDAFKKLYLWIGLSDENKDNTYKWTDGTATVFTKWYRGEPSRRYQGKDEDCGSIIREFTGGMSWSDMNCERKNGFICQTK